MGAEMIKKWIFGEFIKDNLVKYIIGFVALVATSFLSLAIPKLLGTIMDLLKDKPGEGDRIAFLAFLMLGISVVIFCLKFVWRYCIVGRARDLECYLRSKLFAHLQTLPVNFFNNKKTGDLMAHAINDLNAVRRAFAFGLVQLVDGIIINLFSVLVMVETINPMLTLIALGPVTVALVLVFILRKKIRARFVKVQEAYSDISEKVQENISGIRIVKGYVQEEHEIDKLENASRNRVNVEMNYVKLSASLSPVTKICFGISFTLVLVIGSQYVANGVISLGDFIAFNTYLTMLQAPVVNIGKVVEVWQRAMASIKRLDAIFTTNTDIVDDNPTYGDDKFNGSISIKNLSFSYPGSEKKVLEDINIDLTAGKTLAIIGDTGSGKSTLISLLLRLFKVDRGHIFIDGTDIDDIPLSTLRNNIGCVPQDNFLFSAAIKDNIKFFTDIYTDEDVEEATRMSSVYDNIADFPEKFETIVGERGITLSGGQKQRVSIARAIIKNPSILILDDSLSAVDTRTEEEILTNIKDILKDRTGIVIAHRISTIKHADEIVVLDKGRICERGSHQELLEHKDKYYRLYCAQLAESNLERIEEEAI
jgi:ATP-binding cassette subfamily B protein